jgi:hypothetical protein
MEMQMDVHVGTYGVIKTAVKSVLTPPTVVVAIAGIPVEVIDDGRTVVDDG